MQKYEHRPLSRPLLALCRTVHRLQDRSPHAALVVRVERELRLVLADVRNRLQWVLVEAQLVAVPLRGLFLSAFDRVFARFEQLLGVSHW